MYEKKLLSETDCKRLHGNKSFPVTTAIYK